MEVQEIKEQLKEIFRTVINNDKWITIHPNGEDGKGRHLLLKDGETPKEAIERTYGKKDNISKDYKENTSHYGKKEHQEEIISLYEGLKNPNKSEARKKEDRELLEHHLKELNKYSDTSDIHLSDEETKRENKIKEIKKELNKKQPDIKEESKKSKIDFSEYSDAELEHAIDVYKSNLSTAMEYGDAQYNAEKDMLSEIEKELGRRKAKSNSKGEKKYNYTLTKREVEDRKMFGGMADTGNYYTNGDFAIDKKYLNIKGQEPTKKEEIEKSLKHILKGDSTDRYTPVKDFEIGELKREYGKPIKVAKYSYFDEKNGFERHIYLNKKYNDLFKNFDLKFGGETEPVFAYKGKDIVGVVMPINAREQSYSKTVNNEIEEELTEDKNQLKLKIDNSKEQEMALLEELKKLITNVENGKGEEDMEIKNEKVDKRKLIDEVGGILKGKVDDELIRTIIGKMEKMSYDDSERSADNEKEEDKKEVKNEDEEDKKEVKEVKEEIKEDVDNKCKNSKPDFFSKLNEIYNSASEVKESSEYESREVREKRAEEYFA